MLTQEQLKALVTYNKRTGVFRWKKSRSNRVRVGEVIGSKHLQGYLTVRIDKKSYLLHRLVWLYVYGEFPKGLIDHKNRIKTDNRVSNLRVVSYSANHKNYPRQRNNTSGVTGVCWFKQTKRWMAYIDSNNKRHHLGFFQCKEDAAKARKKAERELGFHPGHGAAL